MSTRIRVTISADARAALLWLAETTGLSETFLATLAFEKGVITLGHVVKRLQRVPGDVQACPDRDRDPLSAVNGGARWTDQA